MLEIMFETIGLARKKTQQSKSPQPWVPQKVVPSRQHEVVGTQSLQRILIDVAPHERCYEWKMLINTVLGAPQKPSLIRKNPLDVCFGLGVGTVHSLTELSSDQNP